MSYDAYLLAMNQLAGQKRARVVLQGSVLFIETSPNKHRWQVKTKIFNYHDSLPREAKQVFSSLGMLKWKDRGAYLHLDSATHSVYLIEEIESSSKYVPFKYRMNEFVQVAQEWKEIFEDFSSTDHTSTRIENNFI